MKKRKFAYLILITLTTYTYSQTVTLDFSEQVLNKSSEASRPLDAVGSPYVNEKFLPIKIKGYENTLYTGRYNAYNGEMEINLGTKIIALDKNLDYQITFTQKNNIYRTFKYSSPSGISKSGFLNIVNETPSYTLLKEEIVKYYDKVPAVTTYDQEKPAKFVKEDSNFYLKKGNVIRPFPTKRKDLLKAYPKNAKKIKSFLKEKKISLKKEEDLIKLAGFLATL
ncbi:hypothetical protein [Winogradskyella haliclonae]|uniref:DUF4369 domain-containing protein n=1 Tax=Winogradskyella haliclonae TaxID=2048558 RepID=A0ABQ2BVQ2_9FLAO|nr:hypothetical protein [Winogradskyella haliclonae]GGI56584.1 hypothetical protein GCM10011444_08930 [Winogradskyella haliclonae]